MRSWRSGSAAWSRVVTRLCVPVLACALGAAGAVRTSGQTVERTKRGDTAITRPDAALETFGRADLDWTLLSMEGDTVRATTFAGGVLFLNLWATWCPPCTAELASIQSLHDSLSGSEVTFLAVSPEPVERVRDYVTRRGFRLPFHVELSELPDAFGLAALPTTYVISRDGDIVLHHRGAANWDTDEVRDFLRHLAGPAPASADPSMEPVRAGIRVAAIDSFRYGIEVEFEVARGWHIYGPDPGDAGMPTRIEWTLPDGLVMETVEWPPADRATRDGAVTYEYTGAVVVRAVARRVRGHAAPVMIRADASWVACSDVCVPRRVRLETLFIPHDGAGR